MYFLLGDHLGSNAITTNQYGVRSAELRYYPYGYQRYNTTGQVTSFRYTGQRWDSATGLYYYGARWYDPVAGRFLAADTVVPNPTNPQDLNRYAYCRNNPLAYVDSGGHIPILVIGAAIVIAKAVDYGWTAWDTYQSGRTLADPDASRSDKMFAGLNVALAVGFEGLEPDDLLPVGLPIDDVARRAALKGAREAFEQGGEAGLEQFIRSNLGSHADDVLRHLGLDGTSKSVTDKLQRYLLNEAHPVGGTKARWFREALGFTQDNLDQLAKQIKFDPSKAVQTEITEYGTQYNQTIRILGANGREIDVLFAWIRNNDGVVRLVTGLPGD